MSGRGGGATPWGRKPACFECGARGAAGRGGSAAGGGGPPRPAAAGALPPGDAPLGGRRRPTVEKSPPLVPPGATTAGTVQVVARSVETALHKLHELKFDLAQVVSGYGLAPLPPVSPNELEAIGRSNDAILYGGRVAPWVRADDDLLAAVRPKGPSAAAADHRALFAEVVPRDGDVYKIVPPLFF